MTLIAEEPRAKRLYHKGTSPKLIQLNKDKDDARLGDIERLITMNCRRPEKFVGKVLSAFQMMKP